MTKSVYEPLDSVLVRAPLLPVEFYLRLRGSFGLAGTRSDPRRCGDAGEAELLRDPRVSAALAVGGGTLLETLEGGSSSPRKRARSAGKLLRYLIRMSTRPTPYGLFAGIALARWDRTTDLALADAPPTTRTRPDMEWLLTLVMEMESRPEILRHLRVYANSSSFLRAGRIFLAQRAPNGDPESAPPAVSIRATAPACRAIALAREPIAYETLVAALASEFTTSTTKAERLVETLCRETLLLTDLRPPLTAASPARYVAKRLRAIPVAGDELASLENTLEAMAEWDVAPIERRAREYRRLVEASGSKAPQVDMGVRLQGNRISRAVAHEAVRAAELLLRVTPEPDGPRYLRAYRREFLARYGTDAEVPLLELLDPNFGLGPPTVPAAHDATEGARNEVVCLLAMTASREGRLVVELDDDVLERIATCALADARLPESLDISFFVAASSAEAIDAGRFQIVVGPNVGASSAGRNFGRFCDVPDVHAEPVLAEVSQREASLSPAALRAELVYLPYRFRSANVAVRPLTRTHEIVDGTTPSVPHDRRIPIDEILVGVGDDRFYLRWLEHDGPLVACASHMLTNWHGPWTSQFVADVLQDRVAQLAPFSWGAAARHPFLPRLQRGRIVLSPARWRIGSIMRTGELRAEPSHSFSSRLHAWRSRWQVPRYVYLSVGDNRLLLDLDEPAHVEELRFDLRSRSDAEAVVLEEALPGPEHAWTTGPGGHFVTEFVVPIVLKAPQRTEAPVPRTARSAPAASPIRLRPPGSEWLFAKLYGPPSLEEDLLAGPVAEFCDEAISTGLANGWFFLRYSDPDPHLRIRLRGVPDVLLRQLVPGLCSWAQTLVSAGAIARYSLDTYEREIERYGGPGGNNAAEELFFADSRAVVELLRLCGSGAITLERDILAALSIDDLLDALDSGADDRVDWYRRHITSSHQRPPDNRPKQRRLRALLGDPAQLCSERGGRELTAILGERRRTVSRVARQLAELNGRGELSQSRDRLYESFVHLHCNRLLTRGGPAETEVIELLWRTRQGLRNAPLASSSVGVLPDRPESS